MNQKEPPNSGQERRRYVRRKTQDRRTDIRFEPDKEDRRKKKRRKADEDIWKEYGE